MPSKHQHRLNYDDLVDLVSPVIAGCIKYGIIRDCTDTDWMDEFDLQDDLLRVLQEHASIKRYDS